MGSGLASNAIFNATKDNGALIVTGGRLPSNGERFIKQ
jgi:hypothetical protein